MAMPGVNEVINVSEIGDKAMDTLLPAILDKFSPLITILKVVGIVVVIYIIFLIIKAFFSWRASARIKKIARNVEQINEKLDVLINKKSTAISKEKRKVKK